MPARGHQHQPSLGVARCCPTDPHLDGTIHTGQVRCLPSVFRSVRGPALPLRAGLPAGAWIPARTANFRVSELRAATGTARNARACSSRTAGSNSVHEALLASVPMLAYPAGSDHFAYAARLWSSDAGLRVQPAPDPATLRSLALEILGNPRRLAPAPPGYWEIRCAAGRAAAARRQVRIASCWHTPVPSHCLPKTELPELRCLGKKYVCEENAAQNRSAMAIRPNAGSDDSVPGSLMKRETCACPLS